MKIIPIKTPLKSEIQVPGSKSYTNRAFLIAALAQGKSTIKNPLLSDDTKYMIAALKKLGIKIIKKDKNYEVYGENGKFPRPPALNPKPYTLFLGNAGTAVRFLTAAATLANYPIKITGNKRMQERPIHDLVNGLKKLGAEVDCKNGCPPVIIKGKLQGGTCKISGKRSSQYFSALFITAPYAKKNTTIKVTGNLVSKKYLDQTIDTMKSFGIKIQNKNYKEFKIKARKTYKSCTYEIEPDASSATYFGAIAALTQSEITIKNLNPKSAQADIGFLDVLRKFGCKIVKLKTLNHHRITIKGPKKLKPLGKINLNHMPDGAMTAAVLCAFAKGKSHLIGLQNLKIKETDRLKALTNELQKIGCQVKETKDGLIINGNPDKLHGAVIETYNDHRIAMCFAAAGTKIPGIKIKNPNCVNKTYPSFFKDLNRVH